MGKFQKILVFYLEQLNKLFDVLKKIPVYDNFSLYDFTIAAIVISSIIFVVKTGIKINNTYTKLNKVIGNPYVGKHSPEGYEKYHRKH